MRNQKTFENIFIATPTHICKRYCADRFVKAVLTNAPGAYFAVACNSRGSGRPYYDQPGVHYTEMCFGSSYFDQPDSIHRRITDTARWLRLHFLSSTKCEWYLSLEADVLLSPEAMERLADAGCDVLHTNCYPGFNKSGVICKTDRITMGCTIIRRHVLEKLDFRYDPNLLAAHYDALFAHDCVSSGIEMFYTPNIVLEHMHNLGQRGWQELPREEREVQKAI